MLNTGDRFGDYTVVRLLGKGGMGAVFLMESDTGAQVAAKILDPESAGDHESRKRFVREAELALGVKHANLVETYDVGEDPETGLCYILMEYVSGGSLADRLKQGPLPINVAIRIVYQIASVLELARQKGIVHRDIKPANIMFATDRMAKLADLGIARSGIGGTETTTVTQTGMMIGTPAYMAPEQMLDAHHVDSRADIYSLGIVFYEMLTGQRPNKDDTVVQLMAKAVAGEPIPDVRRLRPEVSAAVAELISLMCAMKVDERVSTPAEVATAIAQIAHGHEVTIRRKRPSAAAKRRKGAGGDLSRKVIAAVFGLAMVAGVAAFAYFGWRANRTAIPSPVVPQTNVVERVVEKVAVQTSVVEKVVERMHVVTNVVVNKDEEYSVRMAATGEPKVGDTMTVTLPRGAKMEFAWCPATTSKDWKRISGGDDFFWMGSNRYKDEKRHRVTLTKGFWMGKYEVTEAQWESVMGAPPPNPEGANRPVIADHRKFIEKFNAEARAVTVALPTEAQWEYACRAGTKTAYCCGDRLDDAYAWLDKVHDVGTRKPNAWGLYDMHGNAWEWCADWYGDYTGDATDPTGPASGVGHVQRGGAYRSEDASSYTSSVRAYSPYCDGGFRLVCLVEPRGADKTSGKSRKDDEVRVKLPKSTKSEFKAKLVGVAVVNDDQRSRWNKDIAFLPPETHIEVPFGKVALFKVEYDFPKGFEARVWTRDRFDDRRQRMPSFFSSNPSGFYSGKGVTTGFLLLHESGKECSLKSLSIQTSYRLQGDDRPSSFDHWEIGSFPVDILFKEKDGNGAAPVSSVSTQGQEKVLDPAQFADEDPPRRVQKAVDVLFPGWKVSGIRRKLDDNAAEWDAAFVPVWRGRKNIVSTMPPNGETGVVLSRTVQLPKRHPVLIMELASCAKDTDFLLKVKVDGRVVFGPQVVCTPDENPYERIVVPLERWRGRQTKLEVVHECNSWYLEHAFWSKLEIAEGDGKERMGPVGVVRTEVFPAANPKSTRWKKRGFWTYVTNEPAADWKDLGFDDRKWNRTVKALGCEKEPLLMSVADVWRSDRIWIRRKFNWTGSTDIYKVDFDLCFDQDVEIYLNGKLVLKRDGWNLDWVPTAGDKEAFSAALRPGENMLAVTLKGDGASYFDCGLSIETYSEKNRK